jgi:serine/threonine protein phosphatase PrpC
MRYYTAAESITGARPTNQDRYSQARYDNICVMLVCDGNGGNGGEVIAECAVRSIMDEINYALTRSKHPSLRKLQQIGKYALAETARYLDMFKRFHPEFRSCGTTATLVFVAGRKVVTLWIGDSPAFVSFGEKLVCLTDPPHNIIEFLVANGAKREELSVQTGLSSIITRCLGHSDATPDLRVMEFKVPMTVLVASDGINSLSDQELQHIIADNLLTECLPGKLIIAALESGSTDNITVMTTKAVSKSRKKHHRCSSRKKFHRREKHV